MFRSHGESLGRLKTAHSCSQGVTCQTVRRINHLTDALAFYSLRSVLVRIRTHSAI